MIDVAFLIQMNGFATLYQDAELTQHVNILNETVNEILRYNSSKTALSMITESRDNLQLKINALDHARNAIKRVNILRGV